MERVINFIRKHRVFYVATVELDQPQVRPFGAIRYHDGKLYFTTGRRKAVYQQLEANPKLALCSYGDGEWLRVTGEAVFEDNNEVRQLMREGSPERAKMFRKMSVEEREKFLEENPGLKTMLAVSDEPSMVFWLKNAVASFYSLNDETVTVTF